MTIQQIKFGLLACSLFFCASCSIDPNGPAPGKTIYNYEWGFVNYSDLWVNELYLYYEHDGKNIYLSRNGNIGPIDATGLGGAVDTSLNTPLYVPDHVVIRWVMADSSGGTQTVSLAGLVQPNDGSFRGIIWLQYYKGMWYPAALSSSQALRQVSHGMTDRPQGIPSTRAMTKMYGGGS